MAHVLLYLRAGIRIHSSGSSPFKVFTLQFTFFRQLSSDLPPVGASGLHAHRPAGMGCIRLFLRIGSTGVPRPEEL
jgi:hypothetical protein